MGLIENEGEGAFDDGQGMRGGGVGVRREDAL